MKGNITLEEEISSNWENNFDASCKYKQIRLDYFKLEWEDLLIIFEAKRRRRGL